MTLASCGGDLLASPQTIDSGTSPPVIDAAPADAGGQPRPDAGVLPDASGDASACTADPSSLACFQWASLVQSFQADAGSMWSCPWDGGYLFLREPYFLAFFREIAVATAFTDPAHGIDCTSGISTCAYDPRVQQLSPQDVHYSNGAGEFLAPDGQPYVWHWDAPTNLWLAADRSTSQRSYALIVARHQDCAYEADAGNPACNCGG